MLRQWIIAGKNLLLIVLVLGLAFPLAVTGAAQLLFPRQANGSLVSANGRVVGSRLIAQGFSAPKDFRPRPSAAGNGYDPNASSASNLGPTSKTLIDSIRSRTATILAEDPGSKPGEVPVDMVTASASGLDPDISVANALLQVPRVARSRRVSVERVRALVEQSVQGRAFGLLGEPRLNVLELNLALDRLSSGEAVSKRS
jgi:potassium-transporting ATPase KdpC subunit